MFLKCRLLHRATLLFAVAPWSLAPWAPGREPQLPPEGTKEKVGQISENVYQTPTNQLLTPAGTTIELPRMRPQAIALSPDGKLLVTSGKTPELVVIDPKTAKVVEKVAFHNSQDKPKDTTATDATKTGGDAKKPAEKAADEAEKPGEDAEKPGEDAEKTSETADANKTKSTEVKPDKSAQLSFTGLTFSPDGSRIYLANVNGDVKVFAVEKGKVTALKTSNGREYVKLSE